METEHGESILEEFTRPAVRRRQLLPWWIKGFSLLFMISFAAAVFCLVYGIFGGRPALSVYGFATNDPFSIDGIIVMVVFFLKGFAAWSLWFEKDYAITVAKADAILGIVLCAASMFVFPLLQPFFKINVRLELVLLIPYLVKIIRIQDAWMQAAKLS